MKPHECQEIFPEAGSHSNTVSLQAETGACLPNTFVFATSRPKAPGFHFTTNPTRPFSSFVPFVLLPPFLPPFASSHAHLDKIPPAKQPGLPWSWPLGDKDLGALLQLETIILLNAKIQGAAQRVGLSLKVLGLGFDVIDKKDCNSLGS